MKIAIDSRSATWYHGTGIGTYTENILRELLSLDSDNEYLLYWSGKSKDYILNNPCKKILTSKKHQRFFQQHFFPYNLQKNNIELYHVPQNGIGLNNEIHCLKVATIHDLIPYIMPETVGKGYLCKFLKEIPNIIDSCDGLITVSEYSKQDIMRFFPSFNPERIFVTPLATNFNFCQLNKDVCKKLLSEKYNINSKFILYMGGFSDRKNVSSLIEAYSKIRSSLTEDVKLIILGSYRDKSQKLVTMCSDLNIEDHVIFAGFIPEEHVSSFYNACEVFVYPSFYEGFGLPPLEAMSCGTPVICSNTTSIPEVVGDCCIPIDPYKIDSISDAICKILKDDNLRNTLSQKGLERAKLFSWKDTAKKTLEAYETIKNYHYCN